MKFDYSKLNGRITEIFNSQKKFAKAMDLSERSISLKLNNQRYWKNNEITTMLLSFKVFTKMVRGLSQNYYSKSGESFISLETDIGGWMEDKIIELADYFISESKTYREAKIACEKLLKQVSHEIELRAMESNIV